MSEKTENIYGGLTIEAIVGGGYVVFEYSTDPNRFSPVLFACSTKGELLNFIEKYLLTSDAGK